MWFDEFEPVHPQNLLNALSDDPRLNHAAQRPEQTAVAARV